MDSKDLLIDTILFLLIDSSGFQEQIIEIFSGIHWSP